MKTKEQGITIIALAITIIVMLILVGISIRALTTNGIITNSKTAANFNKRQEYAEALNLAVIETQMDYEAEDKHIDKGYFSEIKEILEKIDIYEGSTIKFINYNKSENVIHEEPQDNEINGLHIYTKEGFVFIVDENLVIYDGEGNVYEDIKDGIVIFDYDKAWTNKKIDVAIKKNSELQSDNYVIQYKIGENGEYQKYTNALPIEENCTIYARMIDKNKRVVAEAEEKITNIDKVPPTIENFKAEKASCLKIKVSADIQDKESGLEKIVYYYSNNGGSSYNSKEQQITDNSTEKTTKTQEIELEAGTYTIYAEIYDKAENKTETEKKTITLGHTEANGGTAAVHKKCSVCGTTLSSEHTYTESVTKAATCTATGTKKFTCACGYNYTETIATTAHKSTYGGTSSVHTKCSVCGKTLSSTHSFGSWTTTSSATCTSSGSKKRTCSCGYYETQSISSLGHSAGSGPTCTSAQKCTRCGTTLKSALGHSWTWVKVTHSNRNI